MARHGVLNFGLHFEPYDETVTGKALPLKKRIKQAVCRSDSLSSLVRSYYKSRPNYHNDYKKGLDCGVGFFDGRLHIASEQCPNPDSRVRLGNELDRFGNRRVALDWRLTAQDKLTLRKAAEEVGVQLANKKLGRVRLPDWLLDPEPTFPGIGEDAVAGFHHMCTTRMAASPTEGVVNADCKLFGSDNLYLAGSSVFSTAGASNPTFTIVQLSLRLADHLEQRLAKGSVSAGDAHRSISTSVPKPGARETGGAVA